MSRLLVLFVLLTALFAPQAVWAQEEAEYVAGNIANALVDLELIESERASGKVPEDFGAVLIEGRQASLRESYSRADRTGQGGSIRRAAQRRAAQVLAATRRAGFLEGFPDPVTVAQDVRRDRKGEDEFVVLGHIAGRNDRLAQIIDNHHRAVWDSQLPPAAARLKRLYKLHAQDIYERVKPTLEPVGFGCTLKNIFGTCNRSTFWGAAWSSTHAETLAQLYIPEKNHAAFLDAQGPGFSQNERRVELAAAANSQEQELPFPQIIAGIFFTVLAVAGAVVLVLKLRPPKPPPPPPTSTNYGSAEFRRQQPVFDPLAPLTGVFLGKQSRPGQGGSRGFPLFTEPQSHTLVLAPTRTGKGTSIIVPTLLRYIGSTVVIDPKGENAAITAWTRLDRKNKVHILNPWDVLADEFRSQNLTMASLNPLDVVRANDPKAVGIAHALAETVCKRSGDPKNSYWEGNAAAILTAVILWLADEPGEKLTLARVREIVTLPLNDLVKQYFLRMAASSAFDGAIRENIGPFIGMAGNDMGGILRTLNEATRFMSDPQLKKATAASDFDIQKMALEPVTLYLVIPPDMMATQATWLRLVLSAVTSTFRQSPGTRATRCMMLIDELPALGHIPDLETDLATMAGYGLDYVLIVQDLGQLRKHYGQEGSKSILTNCAWKWFSNIRDYDTAKYV